MNHSDVFYACLALLIVVGACCICQLLASTHPAHGQVVEPTALPRVVALGTPPLVLPEPAAPTREPAWRLWLPVVK
jgi:hypothetical protein